MATSYELPRELLARSQPGRSVGNSGTADGCGKVAGVGVRRGSGRGVNPWRRMLGSVVLAGLVASLIR